MNHADTVMLPKPRSWVVEPNPAAIRPMRQLIRQIAASWRVPLTDCAVRDVELCADELLANAIEHTRKPCRVTVQWTGVRLRVEVADRSRQPPVSRAADDMATGGRGLLLIEALAHSWGWYSVEAGKVVWCEVAPDESVTGDARLAVLVFAAQVHAAVPPAGIRVRRTASGASTSSRPRRLISSTSASRLPRTDRQRRESAQAHRQPVPGRVPVGAPR
ncbi:ATP-binding protein [Kitasatospora sp. NPDC089797]|uniref:ATP-binding protein n=1 Tax=Kitasatospora sp. NPDC089797 TaxID=3155298 RepID=UPI0034309790